ncbi:MAG: T9SS type A sorting domain-containing protein [Adhaeribacter sp.]
MNNSTPVVPKTVAFRCLKQVLVILTVLLYFAGNAQGQANRAVSEIITDFGGYWRSGVGAINTVKPNNSHNLLAFKYNGVTYSTGVNDKTLSLRGISHSPMAFVALPVTSVPGTVTTNTKIGLGSMYDGVAVGPSNPPPANNIPLYLSDGVNGLDLGTCVANLPAGTMSFAITNVSAAAIGDGIPDVLVTQVADPSGTSFDRYTFTDANGAQIGTALDIVFSNINPVGQWLADFYEASVTPMTLSNATGSTFTNGSRDIRLWAADFSDFGITSANISNIRNFQIKLSGVSDVAFVAHNNSSFKSANPIGTVLPVSLTYFTGKSQSGQTMLSWQTATEKNNQYFAVETSTDGKNFEPLTTVAGAGNSTSKINYHYTHAKPAVGGNYYRLKQVDTNGDVEYSKIIFVKNQLAERALTLFPNPAHGTVNIAHELTTGKEQIQVLNIMGKVLLRKQPEVGARQTKLVITSLAKGYYQVVYISAAGTKSMKKLIVE